eukprot:TRINITY_DN62454_c0_g1_i1.p1 TRINITY_DN62454_c0_g1~~TRINITY_DN62454_c0_g1_i1.p1  ORF type:complete len:613 (-),score=47.10 TRINITY_DN62454_c0_g1_i1:254-2092(-)
MQPNSDDLLTLLDNATKQQQQSLSSGNDLLSEIQTLAQQYHNWLPQATSKPYQENRSAQITATYAPVAKPERNDTEGRTSPSAFLQWTSPTSSATVRKPSATPSTTTQSTWSDIDALTMSTEELSERRGSHQPPHEKDFNEKDDRQQNLYALMLKKMTDPTCTEKIDFSDAEAFLDAVDPDNDAILHRRLRKLSLLQTLPSVRGLHPLSKIREISLHELPTSLRIHYTNKTKTLNALQQYVMSDATATANTPGLHSHGSVLHTLPSFTAATDQRTYHNQLHHYGIWYMSPKKWYKSYNKSKGNALSTTTTKQLTNSSSITEEGAPTAALSLLVDSNSANSNKARLPDYIEQMLSPVPPSASRPSSARQSSKRSVSNNTSLTQDEVTPNVAPPVPVTLPNSRKTSSLHYASATSNSKAKLRSSSNTTNTTATTAAPPSLSPQHVQHLTPAANGGDASPSSATSSPRAAVTIIDGGVCLDDLSQQSVVANMFRAKWKLPKQEQQKKTKKVGNLSTTTDSTLPLVDDSVTPILVSGHHTHTNTIYSPIQPEHQGLPMDPQQQFHSPEGSPTMAMGKIYNPYAPTAAAGKSKRRQPKHSMKKQVPGGKLRSTFHFA